ncbi:MAG: IS5 family transposase, partial [Tannerella sp.]|nr:IS5 family transposase [Tannerella sp.]
MQRLLLKISHGLKLRQSTGFLNSLFKLTEKSDLPVPDYTTLCRRQRSLPVHVSERLNRGERLDMGIDSTGLKVCGEGEWKVRKHGYSKYHTWRKLHICIDLNTREILSVRLTENGEDDACAAIKMLQGKTGKIKRFTGDGACDRFGLKEVLGKDIEQVIPPPKNAVIQKGKRDSPLPGYLIQRNEAV